MENINNAASMSEKLCTLRGKELCEFIMKLCDSVKADAGTDFRGGIYPENIRESSDGSLHIGPAAEYNWENDELRFIAPELYWNGSLSPAGDVYSVGMLMYYALTDGKVPFEDECEDPVLRRMSGADISVPENAGRRLGEIMAKALSFKAADRYQSMDELRAVVSSCNTSLFLNGAPTAEAVLKKSDDELSDVERMMVSIIESADKPLPAESAEEVDDVKVYEPEKFVEETVIKKPRPTPRPSEMPSAPANKVRVGIAGDKINVNPAVSYTSENIERERKLAKEVRRRRRRPIIGILIMCVLLIGAALVFNYLTNHAPVPMDAEINFSGEPVSVTPEAQEQQEPQSGAITMEEPEEEPEETPAPVEHRYEFIIADVSWTEARSRCEALGGHLVVIDSEEELQEMIDLADENGIDKVWIGCYRNDSGELVWVNGQQVDFYRWGKGEPSAYDYNDDVAEDYVMLWYLGGWVYNDQRNELVKDYPGMYSGRLGFICEFGE